MNLLAFAGLSEVPEVWEAFVPREALRPEFKVEGDRLAISGAGNAHEFGYWRRSVPVTGGSDYQLQVRFRVSGEVDIPLNILNMVVWTEPEAERRASPHDHISHLWRSDGAVHGEGRFSVPARATLAEIQLGLRFAPRGAVEWDIVELTPCEAAAPRPVRVTAVRWHGQEGATLEDNREALAGLVDQAGSQASDLVLLPEYAVHSRSGETGFEVSEQVPDGPSCKVFAHKAKEHLVNVCANVIERDGDLIFNTAVLFDRQGNLVGRYRKVHPYWPEEVWDGITPGDDLPVFALDVGTVGIMTCYDSWFPEASRLLALRGRRADPVPFSRLRAVPAAGEGDRQPLLRRGLVARQSSHDRRHTGAHIGGHFGRHRHPHGRPGPAAYAPRERRGVAELLARGTALDAPRSLVGSL